MFGKHGDQELVGQMPRSGITGLFGSFNLI